MSIIPVFKILQEETLKFKARLGNTVGSYYHLAFPNPKKKKLLFFLSYLLCTEMAEYMCI